MSCVSCTQLAPISKDTSGCGGVKFKLTDFRIACCDETIEVFTATADPTCEYGYISSIAFANIGNPTPYVAIEIVNTDEIDELNDFTFDRTTDTGEDTYTISPLIKIYNPEHECTINSLKGQDICIVYKIEGKTGDDVWRRFKGKVTAVSGGLIAGYTLTIDILNPDAADKPKFVNFSTAAATEAALDLLTQF